MWTEEVVGSPLTLCGPGTLFRAVGEVHRLRWERSAGAWIRRIDEGEPVRQVLLDPVMLDLCGDVEGLRVLDVGCGEGRFSRMLGARGANAIALDPTGGMVAAARDRGTPNVIRAAAESLPLASSSVDLVVSYITLVDIEGYRSAIAEMARVLKPGGAIVLSNVSFASAATPGWIRDEQGNRLYRPIDRYIEERPQHLEWAGISITNWHRPLSAYMDAFLGAGLVLERFLEPVPADQSLRDDPYWEDLFRVPDFLAMRWRKPA